MLISDVLPLTEVLDSLINFFCMNVILERHSKDENVYSVFFTDRLKALQGKLILIFSKRLVDFHLMNLTIILICQIKSFQKNFKLQPP